MTKSWTVRELTPALWGALEELFGHRGACGGCWCMYWRQQKGERWEDLRGPEAKRRLRVLVESGQAGGVLAFDGTHPIGWCASGPRSSFPKIERSPTLGGATREIVHAVPCFFVRQGFRGRGVARALLQGAIAQLRREGATTIEGYPVRPRPDRSPHPAAFAWTGTLDMFLAAGFTQLVERPAGKQRVVLRLQGAR